MIAHKRLTTQGVDDAILNGANAVEMDLTAYQEGWWAQHTGETWHDPLGTLFDHIASKKDEGANIQWVWLDIKTPDAFGVIDGFGFIQGLQKLVRDKVLPHGVTALYGFAVGSSPASTFVKQSLTSPEAINYDGSNDDRSQNVTPKQSIKSLQDVAITRRVSLYGWDYLKNSFGDCFESDFYTCTKLRQTKTSKNWATVLGQIAITETSDTNFVNNLFNNAKVDGKINGYSRDMYHNSTDSIAAAKEIQDWIQAHNTDVKLTDPMPWAGSQRYRVSGFGSTVG